MGYTDVKLYQAGYPAWVAAYGPGPTAADDSAARSMVAPGMWPRSYFRACGRESTVTTSSRTGMRVVLPAESPVICSFPGRWARSPSRTASSMHQAGSEPAATV